MFSLPMLQYEYESLEPSISKEIMELHHSKHHQSYIDKLNAALESYSGPKINIEQLLGNLDKLPEGVRETVRNQGGGHLNHSLFWQWMSPNSDGQPGGHLGLAIEEKYGHFQSLVDAFNEKATKLFGSGWVWLTPDLEIVTTPNQDNPIMQGQPQPILGLDVWEHAYYLDYKNQRDKYIVAWWDIINWELVEDMYDRSNPA